MTAEEAVAAKNARVVDEVVPEDVETRTETVSDTVRRTDGGIEQLGGTSIERSDLVCDGLGTTKLSSGYKP